MENTTPLKTKIPDKQYFRIGEVSLITGVEAYVLRFWQTEFKEIRPKRTSSDQRLYRKSDIKLILKIKNLLHEKKYTIQGAKKYLKTAGKKEKSSNEFLEEIRNDLQCIHDMLN